MKVINKTRSKTLVISAKICSSPISQAQGLMFSKPLKNKCLVFEFKKQKTVYLHMLFVFFPIDILLLDKTKKVIELRQNIKPFAPLIKSKKKAKYVLELPKGTIKRTNTKLKDRLQF